jgi:hypothetical protein
VIVPYTTNALRPVQKVFPVAQGGDGASMEPSQSPPLFNIVHIGKVKRSRGEITPACISSNENKSVIAGTSHRLTLFARCL